MSLPFFIVFSCSHTNIPFCQWHVNIDISRLFNIFQIVGGFIFIWNSMTSVVAASNSDVTTPTSSYVSRWIAQSHGGYAKKSNDFYAFSSPTSTLSSAKSDFRTSIHHGTSPTTTWQAQARLKTENDLSMCQPTSLNNNLEFQEKMTSIR